MSDGYWQCKRHGAGCQSYVSSFVHDLNLAGITPNNFDSLQKEDKELLNMLEWKVAKIQASENSNIGVIEKSITKIQAGEK